MHRLTPILLLFFATLVRGESLTFDAALDRAMRARGVDQAFAAGISRLEAPLGPLLPTLRAEASMQRAETIELLDNTPVRFDALSLLIAADYPLFERQARERRMALARTSAQLFRRRALDEADEVFREALDAFTDLYTAQRRLELLEEGQRHASLLSERARTMLEIGQITSTTAANWEEQALAARSQRLDFELARLDAETRLGQLIGHNSNEALAATIDLDGETQGAIQTINLERLTERDALVDRATLYEMQKRLVVQQLEADRRARLVVSAFGGLASTPNGDRGWSREGSYGIYGLRLIFTLPTTDAASSTRLTEARLELEEATRSRKAAAAATRTRGHQLSFSLRAADERIDILRQQIELAKQRQQSMTRLVLAGMRTEADLFDAVTEVARRESALLAVRIERWRLEQTARQLQMQKKAVLASTPTEAGTP